MFFLTPLGSCASACETHKFQNIEVISKMVRMEITAQAFFILSLALNPIKNKSDPFSLEWTFSLLVSFAIMVEK
jgi:Na+-transporting NADH:ubiquinone oxidoreductase subunit NqrB